MNVGFLLLDQEKAFDRVDHGFLFETMSALGLERFLFLGSNFYA